MVSTMRGESKSGPRRRRLGPAVLLTVAALVGGSFFASAASAQLSHKKTPKPTVVVKEVNNATFGQILTTKKKLALYTFDQTNCTTANNCSIVIWPPLLMPKGKTVPGGATGLGTVPFGTSQLQVTYNGLPLYTFYQDHKNTVNGNGIGGFTVAHVAP